MVTGTDCKERMGHRDVPVHTGASPRYSMIFNENKEVKLYVC